MQAHCVGVLCLKGLFREPAKPSREGSVFRGSRMQM
jgi:hypothetical protein